ncbi:MAG: hypothetical protein C5B54_02170 [Acidobacteria bacterium]|nr:MAG: hypothetical protein C5B54_02170 [Acidobacteriota bacterium]
MSFPEYLRGRISQDYKNLIIQKVEEIKEQTEGLKNTVAPSLYQSNQSLHETLQREIAHLQEVLQSELNSAQEKLSQQMEQTMEDYLASWYHSDTSGFEQQKELLISDVVSNVPPPPVPPKVEHAELASLTDLLHKLDAGATQSEILNIVLHHISGWVDRAVLFVVKGDQATGWAAVGLGPDWDVSRIRQIKVDLNKDNVLRPVASQGEAAYGPADHFSQNSELFQLLGTDSPNAALAFPVTVRGKIAGILYVDMKEDLAQKPDLPNLLYLASRSAGFAIDTLPLKPKPVPGKEAPAPAVATVPVMATPVAVAVPAPPTVAIPIPPEPAPAPVAATVEINEDAAEGTVMMPAMKAPAPVPLTDEEHKLHEDAKRFARLLVSEIKLYNEAQVSAGREKRDLYERLKDDIERSRKMYQDRVPGNVQSASNYFYEELVRTLANGDPTLLGM